MKPIHIAGGGLAGLVLGNLLARTGIPVELHEAGRLPRHRVCGEFVCGRGAALLKAHELHACLDPNLEHRSTIWFRANRPLFRAPLPEPAVGISRFAMDDRLAASFRAAGGKWREGSRIDLRQCGEGWVDGTGRRAQSSPWIGLKLHAWELETKADLELHLGHEGYVGLSRVEDGRVNLCGLFRRKRTITASKSNLLAAYLHHCGIDGLAARLRDAAIDPQSHAAVAGIGFGRFESAGGSALPLGDALGVIPPFTGNGMSIAIESATLAAAPLTAYARGEIEWPEALLQCRTRTRHAFAARIRAAGYLHPWLVRPRRQKLLAGLARTRMLPFRSLYRLTH